jgi:hypothetical protein
MGTLVTNANLELARCPHCSTANPTLSRKHSLIAQAAKGHFVSPASGKWMQWHVYICESCAGLVAAGTVITANQINYTLAEPVVRLVPPVEAVSADVPAQPSRYLMQARETLSSPSASIVMSASAVDAMLKARGYTAGTLHSRIEKAEKEGVLTKDMAAWAHDIRLDANDERHADLDASAVSLEDARKCLEFAEALAELLFVLPARVKRGLTSTAPAG